MFKLRLTQPQHTRTGLLSPLEERSGRLVSSQLAVMRYSAYGYQVHNQARVFNILGSLKEA